VVMKSTIFWDITPRSPLIVNRRFGGTYCLHLQGRKNKPSKKPACHLLSHWFLAQLIFSTLKMEAICSSETSVDTQWTTRRYIPEDGTLLHNLFSKNKIFYFNCVLILSSRLLLGLLCDCFSKVFLSEFCIFCGI
jgi:hypothetical protein